MVKTTVYLPDHLKHRIEETARRKGLSEAEYLRQAIQSTVDRDSAPRPRTGILRSAGGPGTSDLSLRVDEILAEGFGEDDL
jgi:Arc/MetJ-type ribon-helix-helix transcriptional regulator